MARDFSITGQRQYPGLDQGRNTVDWYEINYAGPNGITGSVRVQVSQADPGTVDQLIRQQLATQLAIAGLGDTTG